MSTAPLTHTGLASARGAVVVRRPWRIAVPLTVAGLVAVVSVVASATVGAAGLPLGGVIRDLFDALPGIHVGSSLTHLQHDILWQVRLPRIVLGLIVGAMLSGGGAAYQGVFRNPLADPYLLGVAAGAGLGATVVIVGGGSHALLPIAAFVGGLIAVMMTYSIGASVGRSTSVASIALAGVAVASLLTAVQTYEQQRHVDTVREVYTWILGRLSTASWSDVRLVLPYVLLSLAVLLAHARLLDVLRVGEIEADALGIDSARVRIIVVVAATLGTAAVVSVSGLIGFVGIIVPHAVRLVAGSSYRVVLPVSIVAGGAFVVLADVVARTVQAPAELPIGVVTALLGAPFFLVVLRSRRAQRRVR